MQLWFFSASLIVGILLSAAAVAQNSIYAPAQTTKSGSGSHGAFNSGGSGTSGSFSGTTYAPPQRFFSKNDSAVTPDSPYSSPAAATGSTVLASPAKTGDQSGKKESGSLSRALKPELKSSGMLNNNAGGQFSNGYSAGFGFQNGYSAGTQFSNRSSAAGQKQISPPLEYVRMPDGTYRASGPPAVRDGRLRGQ